MRKRKKSSEDKTHILSLSKLHRRNSRNDRIEPQRIMVSLVLDEATADPLGEGEDESEPAVAEQEKLWVALCLEYHPCHVVVDTTISSFVVVFWFTSIGVCAIDRRMIMLFVNR